MSKDIHDPILSVLKQYERNPARNGKKAVLLTPQGGYFLYGNRFCSIQDYELDFQSDSWQTQGRTVRQPLFLGVLQDGFHAVGGQPYSPQLVSLIFHIDLGEDELLRGILLAVDQEAKLVLFCDAAVEELYRLSRKTEIQAGVQVPPDGELQRQAEELRRNDLHGLTGLYLRGAPLKERGKMNVPLS